MITKIECTITFKGEGPTEDVLRLALVRWLRVQDVTIESKLQLEEEDSDV